LSEPGKEDTLLVPKDTPSTIASKLSLRYHYSRRPDPPASSLTASVPFETTNYDRIPSSGGSPRGKTTNAYAPVSSFPTSTTSNYGHISSMPKTSNAYGDPSKLTVPQSNYGVVKKTDR